MTRQTLQTLEKRCQQRTEESLVQLSLYAPREIEIVPQILVKTASKRKSRISFEKNQVSDRDVTRTLSRPQTHLQDTYDPKTAGESIISLCETMTVRSDDLL